MPNGGSDCCGTCWFNKKNKGQARYEHTNNLEPDFCMIRDLKIDDPFYTYCVNHPHHNSDKIEIPIGPVYVFKDYNTRRDIWVDASDTEEARQVLLDKVSKITETPEPEYPSGTYLDEVIIWQLGKWQEKRAIPHLERITAFDPEATSDDPFPRNRKYTIELAKQAITEINTPDEE